MSNVTTKRLEAGSYACEVNGKKFGIYRRTEREYRGRALKNANQHGSYTFVSYAQVTDWTFNLNDGRGLFGGYGTKDQAIRVAVKILEAQ